MTETREYHTQDKSTWGKGPWQAEPDKRQWRDEATGLPCLIVRNEGAGNLCGYVGVSKDHPAHGKEYNFWKCDDEGNEMVPSPIEAAINSVEVHGGLTFADPCGHGGDESRGVCHVPAPGEPDDVWWFGFDCAHFGDMSPGCAARYPKDRFYGEGTYRTVAYVAGECAALAQQLAAMKS